MLVMSLLTLRHRLLGRIKVANPVRWMGAVAVEVMSLQEKPVARGGNLPDLPGRRRRGSRGRRASKPRGPRREARLVKRNLREESASVIHSQLPPAPRKGTRFTRAAKARRHFVDWVDRRVELIKERLVTGCDVRTYRAWADRDFVSPPYLKLRQREVRERIRNPRRSPPLRHMALAYALRLVRRLTVVKGRPPGGVLYVDRALAMKLRDWSHPLGEDPGYADDVCIIPGPPVIAKTSFNTRRKGTVCRLCGGSGVFGPPGSRCRGCGRCTNPDEVSVNRPRERKRPQPRGTSRSYPSESKR